MNVDRAVRNLRAAPVFPEQPEPEYLCAACCDTGFIEVDDGLEDGRRVRAPQVARCGSIAHTRPLPRSEPTPERFS